MTKYLLPCSCGKTVPVDLGQAGGRVACSCGNQIDVPQLRKLRHLPTADFKSGRAASSWSARHGVITASLILASVFTSIGLWNWHKQPVLLEFEPATFNRYIENQLSQMSPVKAWVAWIEHYRPMAERGFPIIVNPDRAEIEQEIAHRHFVRSILWGIAGIFAAIAATAAFWPGAEKTRRHGETETRRKSN